MKFYYKLSLFFSLFVLFITGCNSSSEITFMKPGTYDNYILLPNNWKLTPIGEQIDIGEFPINMILIENDRFAVTSNSGTAEHSISLIDLHTKKETQRIILNKTWRGLDYDKSNKFLYVSGGNDDLIYILKFSDSRFIFVDTLFLRKEKIKVPFSVTGLKYIDKFKKLLAVTKGDSSLYIINLKNHKIENKIKFTGKCYDIITNQDENIAYISLWSESKIIEFDLTENKIKNIINVGDHPCEMLIKKSENLLFVANANNNTVSVVDLNSKKEIEKLNSAILPDLPYGSTPNSITFNEDETRLFIANADNNYVAVFDISKNHSSKSLGFIPTGWYPTCIKFSSIDNSLIIANGKGSGSKANPDGPNPVDPEKYRGNEYIGALFKGTISTVPQITNEQLTIYSELVYKNTPLTKPNSVDKLNLFSSEHNLIPSDKIKYVFYIIKENRTYDQIFGDLPQGMGDSNLCIFPRKITPNHHKLAEEFVLFDNFYCDAEVSADGHNWSTAAYATDYVEKNWPTLYGGRGGTYDFEGGVPAATPSSGYIWDNVIKSKLSYRNYGEFVKKDKDGLYSHTDEYMQPYTCREFPGFDMNISDVTRYEIWERDFDSLLSTNSFPNLSIIRLPCDHTEGTKKGVLTPTAMVAQNDYALGLMVEKISKSKIWNQSVIFVVEDDAQNGSDHIDAHRSILLAISPYIKKSFVDHTLYSTSSILKTIELILGLPPMTQFDLFANPIIAPFQDQLNERTYSTIKPLVDIFELNADNAYGSERCEQFDFSREDNIPDIEFNEIIWKSVKGKDAVMPPPVRSAFVKLKNVDIDEDDD